jgi:hypothetical protein
MECDWQIKVVTCDVCWGSGVRGLLGQCPGCVGTGKQEVEGPPDP